MYEELRKQAKKKVEAKKGFYICAIVFSSVTVVLLMLSFYMPAIGFWLRLPIPIFIMVLAVLYITAFGFPTANGFSEDWEEEEIQKEMARLYRQKKAESTTLEGLSETDTLELKNLERQMNKRDLGEDFV